MEPRPKPRAAFDITDERTEVKLKLLTVPSRLTLSDLQWTLARVGRLGELATWVAAPELLIEPEKIGRQLERETVPRLPARYATGIKLEADLQFDRIESGSLDLTTLVLPHVLDAMVHLRDQTATLPSFQQIDVKKILEFYVGGKIFGGGIRAAVKNTREDAQRITLALPDFSARLREIKNRFGEVGN